MVTKNTEEHNDNIIEPEMFMNMLLDKFYNNIESRKEKIEAMYNDFYTITENIEAYGYTHEQSVLNYCTYRQDLVMGFYRKKERLKHV
jgi:hypothetical protein